MQLHRDSRVTVTESAEDYYRSRTVYIPFLDSIIRQFNERSFTHARIQPCDLSHYCQVRGLCVKHYVWQRNWGTDNVSPSDSRWWRPADIVRLQCRWPDVSTSERPTDCPLALAACDKTFYPYTRVHLIYTSLWLGHILSNVLVCGLLITRRIKSYWKKCSIDLREWLKVFR